MAYKDKDKQREAVKAATKRYRAKKGDSALSGSKAVSQNARGLPVVDKVGDTDPVIPKCDTHVDASDVGAVKALHQLINKPKRGPDIKYQMTVMERLFYRPASKLGRGETNFVSLPGRACYGVV